MNFKENWRSVRLKRLACTTKYRITGIHVYGISVAGLEQLEDEFFHWDILEQPERTETESPESSSPPYESNSIE